MYLYFKRKLTNINWYNNNETLLFSYKLYPTPFVENLTGTR